MSLTRNQNATNTKRAERGREILDRYRDAYDRFEDDETVLNDILADFMHALRGQPIDFEQSLEYARHNYHDELTEEGE